MVWLVVVAYLLFAGVAYGIAHHFLVEPYQEDVDGIVTCTICAFSWPLLFLLALLVLVGKAVLLPGRLLWKYGYRLYERMRQRVAR